MVLSSSERDDLIRRVEQKLGRTPVRAQLVREVVDRTLGALPDLAAAAPRATTASAIAIFSATSTPDLASRVRLALAGRDVTVDRLATATEGRHTVVTLHVPASSGETVRSVATAIGARVSWRAEGA